ncbi:MAG: hypothetical protein EAZ26_02360, partial [Runella slithyformis]
GALDRGGDQLALMALQSGAHRVAAGERVGRIEVPSATLGEGNTARAVDEAISRRASADPGLSAKPQSAPPKPTVDRPTAARPLVAAPPPTMNSHSPV